jgi:Icc-related predicted phosphoesterase
MRLLVLSDIHLEFGPFALPEDLGEFDAAVFAGDVGRPITAAIRWVEQQRRGPLKGRPTIFVPGNHEFYHGEIHLALREGQALAEQCAIHMLAPGCVVVGNVRFIGATLWTDFNLFGKSRTSRVAARHGMNDHRLIHIVENGRRRAFAPEHAVAIHRSELAFIMEQLSQPFDGATVVVSHHAPHPGSIQPKFRGDQLAPAYCSDLTRVIDQFQPELWIHGHDHGSHDYHVGRTRILSNQAGYTKRNGGRENPNFDPRLIVEVLNFA